MAKNLFAVLMALALLVALAAPVAAAPTKVPVIIGFAGPTGPADEALVRRAGGDIKHAYHLVPAIAASVPEAAIDGLRRSPRVTAIDPDGRVWAIDAELDNSWGVKRIGAGTVHDGGNKGAGVKVAIVDSGIDYNHPDLDANYAGGYDFVNNDTDPKDDYGHGTHVAGSACAEDNDVGVVGVAPECDLYAVKVLNASGSGSWSDIIAAMQWAVDNGMQVANLSLGSSVNPGGTVEAAFNNAEAAGVLIVAAAGNSGNPRGKGNNVIYPARYDSVIAVAATDSSDNRASFSSTGDQVELAAPGVSINSTKLGGGYIEYDGTSMASPHVAGTGALVLAANPGWSNDQVRTQLQSTADDLGKSGRDPQYGYGLVDAAEAAVPSGPVNEPPAVSITSPADGSTFDSGATILFEGTASDTEDGDLTTGLVWTSDIDDQIGTGGSFSTTLSDGNHTITAAVTDSDGATGSASISITVGSAPPPTAGTILAESTEFRTEAKGKSGNIKLLLDVHVVDGNGAAVGGATVSVKITAPDGTLYTGSGDTNSSGDITFGIPGNPKSGTWYGEVTNIEEPGYEFDPTVGDTTAEITI